jgi:hypothetical protein
MIFFHIQIYRLFLFFIDITVWISLWVYVTRYVIKGWLADRTVEKVFFFSCSHKKIEKRICILMNYICIFMYYILLLFSHCQVSVLGSTFISDLQEDVELRNIPKLLPGISYTNTILLPYWYHTKSIHLLY